MSIFFPKKIPWHLIPNGGSTTAPENWRDFSLPRFYVVLPRLFSASSIFCSLSVGNSGTAPTRPPAETDRLIGEIWEAISAHLAKSRARSRCWSRRPPNRPSCLCRLGLRKGQNEEARRRGRLVNEFPPTTCECVSATSHVKGRLGSSVDALLLRPFDDNRGFLALRSEK